MQDKRNLYAALGIVIDSIVHIVGFSGEGRSKYKKSLRSDLFELFKVDYEAEIRRMCGRDGLTFSEVDSARYLDRPLLLEFIKYIGMIMATEYGIEVEIPNKKKQSTRNLTLSEYLKLIGDE